MTAPSARAANGSGAAAWIQLADERSGGHRYGEEARAAVRDLLPIAVEDIRARGPLRPFRMQARLAAVRSGGRYDTIFLDNAAALVTSPPPVPRHVLVVLHLGAGSISRRLERFVMRATEPLVRRHILAMHRVVTISRFWEDRIRALGHPRVETIYNGFDLDEFAVSEDDIDAFRRRHGLTKPIVYIGNCQPAKGAPRSYEALRDLDVHLVTSGRPVAQLPALNINGTRREYLELLAASAVVVTMSTFDEGWCRTAHEAMLLGRPVVGSGRGGMGELLAGGAQVTCPDFRDLRGHVSRLLADPPRAAAAGETGRAWARTFTADRFRSAWRTFVQSL
ncbi:MAG TPA: glycosyltransferase family 4 protein [Gemmatimonadaceae bacterium]|nr:glycosyltransferase family 4 protein [Gemmatimonadaceae bacterium]